MRWGLGILLNPLFPTIPLGTLAANLIGGFLMGVFMALTKDHAFFPESARLAIATGFLGSLTTFSTFSAETITLFSHQEYLWTSLIIASHLFGTLSATISGIYLTKFFIG
jgi:CrcB protein